MVDVEIISDKLTSSQKSKAEVIDVSDVQSSLPALRSDTSVKVQDPLTVYLKEIARYKLLSLEEEKELTQELFETGGLLDELNRSLAHARGQGLPVKQPLFFHRAVRGLPFSTLDPEGLYEHFQLTPPHLIPFLTTCAGTD